MLYCSYGKTTKSQCGFGHQGPSGGGADPGYSNLAHGPSGSVTGFGAPHFGTNGKGLGSGAGYGGSPAESLPARGRSGFPASATLGWAATRAPKPGGRAGVPGRVAAQCGARRIGDRFTPVYGPEPKSGPAGARVGCVSLARSPRLAESGSRYPAPQERSGSPGGVEKKTLPEKLATVLTTEAVHERPIRLMFQDEARFGRMARIRRCWAPAPLRPMVRNGYERQFTYVYGAVSPLQGQLDWSLSPNMNTEQMNGFLLQVSQSHPDEFIVMVLDGASSHKSKELVVPENIRLLSLPGYSPELNPEEHIWDELREKVFPNAVLDHMDLVVERLKEGMSTLASDADRVRSITSWPWIVSLNLTAS